MKETPISTCEKTFVQRCIQEKRRLDGRKINDFRSLIINLGSDWGSAHVSLGETRVLAQVSCELGQPKATRPNEGMLFINVELSPMAAVHFEAGRNSDLTVQINRILERTLKDSRCIDLESLCITAEDRAWILRCDVIILNHEGNLIDCAAVAALTALAHFKRPDVTVSGDDIKVHTSAEKDPIPLALHHFPVCVSYATFQEGQVAVADPTVIEERCSEANMVFGLNSFRELCCLNLGGTTHTSTDLLLRCSHRAANRAKEVVDQIKQVLAEDLEARTQGKPVGFTECLRLQKISCPAEDKLFLKLPYFSFDTPYKSEYAEPMEEYDSGQVESIDENTGILRSNQPNIKWVDEDSNENASEDDDDDDDDDDQNLEQELTEAKERGIQQQNQPICKVEAPGSTSESSGTSSGSEDESTMILG